MRKITSLLILLCMFVGTAWGQNVVTSTEDSPIYYVISSYNRGGVITYANVGEAVQHTDYNENSLWYFEAVPDNENNGVYIVNKSKSGEDKVYLDGDKKASTTPAVWYVLENGVNNKGFSISSTNPISGNSCIDANNSNTGVGSWSPSDADWEGTTWVFHEATDLLDPTYNPNGWVTRAGEGGRYIKSIKINGVQQTTTPYYGLVYFDLTESATFNVAAGSEVEISIDKNGNWMQAFAYVDFDGNGFTTDGVDTDGYTPTGDLVTYSCYDADDDEAGVNSAGAELTGAARNTVAMPNFTAPETPGVYRLRVKYDWNDLDPNGADGKINSAGGVFVDVTLNVVSVDQMATVTYIFKYGNEEKGREVIEVTKGSEYPACSYVAPYGVIVGAKPAGYVSADGTHQIALTKEKEFTSVKTVVDAANIDTWYYVQMHANGNVTSYIEDNGGSTVEWTDKTVAQADIESHLWGFVGDVFGMKMVNKKTGKAIASTGSGNASMSDVNSATSFVVMASQANDPWFCFKYPTNNNYLNAQGDCINHWAANDNGSSFKATEYKIHEVEVGTAGYATLYLGSKVFIPETVEAYVVSEATGNYASLTQVTGSLPANTGVILKGEGTHQFITSADAATTIESNLLAGSVENTYVAGPAYVLANGTNGVGLYKATLNKDAEGADGDTHFLNNAFKAYLPATAGGEARFLVFNFGDDNATAIEGIEAENATNAVAYDLAGRRVQNAQKGIFIVNGKKVVK